MATPEQSTTPPVVTSAKRSPQSPPEKCIKRLRLTYDSKVAATDDNGRIYGLGIRGLHSLITLNSVFREYENTLFDRTTTVGLERSVETSNVIKKFLLHLSPYFLQKPAHDCLEWLVRVYRINEHNIDDMMALMLPYHETEMFVKCIQTIPLNDVKSSWHWMKKTQKSGKTLSKQDMVDRAASDPFLFEFILKRVNIAVDELNEKANALQSWFTFYTIITLGMLDDATMIKEFHVSIITGAILKGLSSGIVDFCVASMTITALLVTKIELAEEFVNKTIEILANIFPFPEMKQQSLITLVLIHQTQNKNSKIIIEKSLAKLIDNSTIDTLIGIHNTNKNVLSLCLPLIAECLGNVHKNINTKRNQRLVQIWICELSLNNDGADALIRCILNALKSMFDWSEVTTSSSHDKLEVEVSNDESSDDEREVEVSNDESEDDDEFEDEVILISDDEEIDLVVDLSSGDENDVVNPETPTINQWYSRLLTDLEIQYSDVFDAVVKDILSKQDKDSSSLKIVLGRLLCTQDQIGRSSPDIVANLYHPRENNRQQAVKELVNMGEFLRDPSSNNKINLLLLAINERLSDSSPVVVKEVLKFPTDELKGIVGEKTLIKKLKNVLGDGCMRMEQWRDVIGAAISHITSDKLLSDSNEIEIFLAVWPFMFPYTSDMFDHTKTILKSSIANRFPIFKQLQNFKFKDNDKDFENFDQFVNNKLKRFVKDSKIEKIVEYVRAIPDVEITVILAFHIIHLLTHFLGKDSDPKLSAGVFDIVSRFAEKCQLTNEEVEADQLIHTVNALEALPIEMIVNCIQSIIQRTNFSEVIYSTHIDYTSPNEELILAMRICDHLCTGLRSETPHRLYNEAMLDFFKIVPSLDKKFAFFSNFFINPCMDQLSGTPNCFYINPIMQLRNMLVFNKFLNQTDESLEEIGMDVCVRLMSGLTSPYTAIRTTTYKTVEVLHKLLEKSSRLSKFLDSLCRYKERFKSFAEALSMFLSTDDQSHEFSHELFKIIPRPATTMIMKASLLNILHDINGIEYLELIVNVALDILTKIGTTEKVILSHHESIVIDRTIERFNSETISSISKTGNCRIFFEKVLQQSNVFVQRNNNIQSIPVRMMNFDIYEDADKNAREIIIESIIRSASFTENEEVRSAAEHFFKQLDGKVETDILCKMIPKEPDVPDERVLQTSEWRCGVTFLEFLLQHQQTQNAQERVRELFLVLKFLNLNYQPGEYTKQLVLHNIWNFFESISPKVISADQSKILVECIQETQDPQAHHIALKLLTKLTTTTPSSIVDIIKTLITCERGSVADNYQRVSDTITSLVPRLNEKDVFDLLKKFNDAILVVPSYHRSSLYGDLLKTLDPKTYLSMFLEILFVSYIKCTDDTEKSILMQTAIDITNLFDCGVFITTCSSLIRSLHSQLNEVSEIKISRNSKQTFTVSLDQCVLYRNTILHFISVLTGKGSEFFATTVSFNGLPAECKKDVENIIWRILENIKDSVTSSSTRNIGNWGDYLDECWQILDHLLDLHGPEMLLEVVEASLSEKNDTEVRIKILDLFNHKLKLSLDGNDSLSPVVRCLKLTHHSFQLISKRVTAILVTITNTTKTTPTQNTLLQSNAVRTVKLLSQTLTKCHPNEFSKLLEIVAEIFSQRKVPIPMRAILVECVGVLCANLRLNAINYVHLFMSPMKTFLKKIIRKLMHTTSRCFGSILHGIYRIVHTLSYYLRPYLVDLIGCLSIMWPYLQSTPSNDWQQNSLTLRDIWDKLYLSHGLGVLIPLIKENIYPNLLKEKEFDAIGPLMSILLQSDQLDNEDVAENSAELMTFFLDALEFRFKFHIKCADVDEQEDVIIEHFLQFILRLSETSFLRLYNNLHEWSKEDIGSSFDRVVTFYRLSYKLAEATKKLDLTFATIIIQDSVNLLQRDFTEAEIKASSTKPITLIYYVLATLDIVFLSSETSIRHRFNVFMEPIVDLLNKEDYLVNEDFKILLPKCLSNLAVAVNDDLWKLQYKILGKTGSNSAVVKRCALTCYVDVILNFGEDSTQFYVDLIPFFAEVLKCGDSETVDLCQECIRKIEEKTYEPLELFIQKFLNS